MAENTPTNSTTLSPTKSSALRLATHLFHPGMRLAVACSGGADSVALLRALLDQSGELGLVLSVAHLNHGIRGEASIADASFVQQLAETHNLPFHHHRVDTPALAQTNRQGLEEAARQARYQWFWSLLAANHADAIATAHTLDDQAETVLHRLLRGAWTEGLSAIHPVLKASPPAPGSILRPLLHTTRHEIETYLHNLQQPWREDETNRDPAFTRNRIRHELLPALATYNPQIKHQLAQLATLARDEEDYWQSELARFLPSLLLPGKPVRGGGRATSTLPGAQSIAIEIERLRTLHPALRRRVLRAAAVRLGHALDFAETARLLTLCGLDPGHPTSRPPTRLQLEAGLLAERTPRELRLQKSRPQTSPAPPQVAHEYAVPVPGSIEAPAFGLSIEIRLDPPQPGQFPAACLRAARPGDRVTLRHTRSPLKLQEALRRANPQRPEGVPHGPVLEWQGKIVWAQGLGLVSAPPSESNLPPHSVLTVTATPIAAKLETVPAAPSSEQDF